MRFNMKTIGLGAALLLGTSPAAFAAGTEAGSLVSNSIDVTYQSGGQTVTNNDADTADFVVDYKVDLAIEGQDGGKTVTAAQGLNDATLDFLLTNEGNKASGYNVDVTSTGGIGLTYDPAGGGNPGEYSVYLSSDGVFDGGDTVIDTNGVLNATDLAPDADTHVLVVANVPNSAADGQTDTFDVTATALDETTNTPTTETSVLDLSTEDVVFADPGEDGIETDAEDLVITAPQLTFSKTANVISENRQGGFDCATGAAVSGAEAAIPGACVEYTISITNDASATSPASTLQVTDAIPADVTYVTDDDGGFDAVSESGGTVTGDLATLAAGNTAEFTIRVTVD